MYQVLSALVLSGFFYLGVVPLTLAQSTPPPSLSLIGSGNANKLGLTPAQIKEIIQLQKQIHSNIEGILTPPQLQQFQASLAQGVSTRDALKSADLTIRQKVRVKNVMEGASMELKTILTPEQFAEIETKFQ